MVYYREFLFFNVLFIAVIFLLTWDISLLPASIISIIVIDVSALYLIGRRRNKELDEIKTIINNIRKNKYNSEDEILLGSNLLSLQKAIKKMFKKEKSDIEYLQRLQKMRSQFLANVSHELRTPIFAIQGYIETLLNGAINDKNVNMHFLQKANQNTISLSNLLNDLIDISMIESGEMRMSFRYFKINDLISQVVQENKQAAESKNLSLIFYPAKDDLEVFGDKEKLKQVLVNLILNAVKYTEKGKIEVLVEEEIKHAKVIVRDTGIGIPENYLDRIFERFFRIDKARSRAEGGTGLGLAIVKHIIEAHNSKVTVTSMVGQGSEFSFLLKK
ncbi:MAG: two-component sensor histidine kinase [bacterium]|nr:two-component sensor histidine kinase [bacterium]